MLHRVIECAAGLDSRTLRNVRGTARSEVSRLPLGQVLPVAHREATAQELRVLALLDGDGLVVVLPQPGVTIRVNRIHQGRIVGHVDNPAFPGLVVEQRVPALRIVDDQFPSANLLLKCDSISRRISYFGSIFAT